MPSATSATPAGPHKLLTWWPTAFACTLTEKIRVIEAIETALKRGGPAECLCAAAGRAMAQRRGNVALFHRPALPRQRPALHRPDAVAVFLQFGHGRLRDLPRLWPRDRRRLRAGDSERQAHAARRRHQGHADAGLEGSAGRPDAPRRGRGHSARHALVQAHARAAGTGSSTARRNWNGKWNQHWFGIKRFFEYLESKAYKMHIRVLLSKYRSYTPCETCGGARLKLESLLWRLGTQGGCRCGAAAGQALHAGRACNGRARSSKPCRACACTT